jgi:apolipoprotein N-acyltransferase
MVGRTAAAAARGARVIVWHETSVPVLSEDLPALLRAIRRIAREEQVYVAAAFAVIDRDKPAQPRVANRVTLIGVDGVVSVYDKAKPVPGLEKAVTITGDGNIPVSSTAFGRLATAICSDLDHPDYLRQVGVRHADVLLVPAIDWQAIRPARRISHDRTSHVTSVFPKADVAKCKGLSLASV